MKIKEAQGSAADIIALESLLARPGLASKTKAALEKEIRCIRAGDKGEREAAYEIDFDHGPSRNWAVIHDLRIEHDGLVAQIDHLLIGRYLDVWVCETKHFSQGVAINEQGEFTRFHAGKPAAIASPLEQNRKHVALLERILHSDKVTLPTRLGVKLKPKLHSVVLISKNARITRPKTKVNGMECIVKSDQLRTHIERAIDDESATTALMTMGKLLSSEALEGFARQVARLHRPARRDWAATFGLDAVVSLPRAVTSTAASSPISAVDEPVARSAASQAKPTKPELLPTSKLGAAMGMANVAATLERLRLAGYLERINDSDRLTERGKQVGGQYIEKSRFGPYFVWPNSLRC